MNRVGRRIAAQRKRIRRALFALSPCCWYCGYAIPDGRETLDHILPLCRGGTDDPENLALACKRCNRRKANHPLSRIVCPLQRGRGLEVIGYVHTTRKQRKVMKLAKQFDYAELEAEVREIAKRSAKEIHARLSKASGDIVEIGLRLMQVRNRMPGKFLAWLAAEFEWHSSTGYTYMKVAERFEGVECVAKFRPAALTVLARDGVPEKAFNEALKLAKAGTVVTYTLAKEIRDRHAPPAARKSTPLRLSANRGENVLSLAEITADPAGNLCRFVESVAKHFSPAERRAVAEALIDLSLQLRASADLPAVAQPVSA